MSANPSREKGPFDRWTYKAKEEDVYWLCECGLARTDAGTIMEHLDEAGHFAERINSTTGVVTGFLAGGLEDNKYEVSIPETADIQRKKQKNEPLFEDPRY